VIKAKRNISFLILIVAFGAIGCNPGIMDVPPPQVTDASAYFWNTSGTVTFNRVDSSGGVLSTFSLSVADSANSFMIKESHNGAAPDTLNGTTGSDNVTISGLSTHSIIPLPDGYSIKPKINVISYSYPASVRHILAVSANNIIATTATLGIHFSTDAGKSWQQLYTNFGGASNPVTALTSDGQGRVFAGAEDGSVYLTDNFGSNWNLIKKFPNSILALAANPNSPYELFISARDTVYYYAGGSVYPINASNSTNFFSSLAYSISGADSILMGGTTGNGLWYYTIREKTWHQASTIPSTVHSVISTPLGLYCSAESSIYYSQDAINWTVISQSVPNAVLTYDAIRHAVIAANSLGSVISISADSVQSVKTIASIPVQPVNDLSAYNSNYFAATDSGIYSMYSSQNGWLRGTDNIGGTHTDSIKSAGEIVLLHSNTGGVSIDSNWEACTMFKYPTSIPITVTARILGHLDSLSISGKTYVDVIGVRYASELTPSNVAPTIPYWVVYYGKNEGPLVISQILGTATLSKAIRQR
jgi:hypothetical protein